MPRAKPPRMSFAPATPSPAPEPRTTTGWVYRSDAPPADPPASPALRVVGDTPGAATRRRSTSWLDALTLPFTLVILLAMPWGQRPRPAATPPWPSDTKRD
jgi:hypothetical protein